MEKIDHNLSFDCLLYQVVVELGNCGWGAISKFFGLLNAGCLLHFNLVKVKEYLIDVGFLVGNQL